jgi:uncharacterized protein (TIRG00374 family)
MNEQQPWLRRRWKLVVNVVTVLALLVLVYAIREQLVDTFNNLKKVNAWALLLIIPIELLNYHAQAKLYQGLFQIVGNKLTYKQLYKAALELNFVNHVFPSGGVTGMSYFSLRIRQGEELTGAKATLVNFMKLALIFLSFEVLIVFAVLALAVMGRVNNLILLFAGSLSTLLLVATAGFFYMLGKRERINGFFSSVTFLSNRLIHVVRPRHPETFNTGRAHKVIDDVYDNYQAIKSSYKQLKEPFLYALMANVTEILAVYVVFIAFGHLVNIGAVILAYAVANFAGMISILPGGVGIYEALMTTALAATGVPARISIPVIVMYRVVNTLLQVPPGYYLYHQHLSQGRNKEADNAAG